MILSYAIHFWEALRETGGERYHFVKRPFWFDPLAALQGKQGDHPC